MARKQAARPTVSRPRLADVARDAGVSAMTVVRVLRDPGKVAKSTRERVAASLHKTKYTPDLVARALVSRRSGIVGAIVPTLANSLIAEVMQGMTAELASHEQQLIVGTSAYSARNEEDLVRSFLSRRVDAIYLTGTSHTHETVKLLKASGVPVVEGGNLPQAAWSSICWRATERTLAFWAAPRPTTTACATGAADSKNASRARARNQTRDT
jgi:LacI family gluconate utilization system Gnt-I transcriptional repressor